MTDHAKLRGCIEKCPRMYYEKIIVSNLLFLKLLKVKVGFSEKYAYFIVKSAIIFSGRPQKLEAAL